MKAAVLLSGCGLYDGSEIHESVLAILHLTRAGFDVSCFAPMMEQHHVVDHRTGDVVSEFRNVLVESARIARGRISPLTELRESEFDCLVLPGGFGVAKNLTKWAFLGASGGIYPAVRDAVRAFVESRRPVLASSMAATTVAKAIQLLDLSPRLTVGNLESPSPYNVLELVAALESTGARHVPCAADQPCIDEDNRIVSVPCHLLETDILSVDRGLAAGVEAVLRLSDAAAVSRITAIEHEDTPESSEVGTAFGID